MLARGQLLKQCFSAGERLFRTPCFGEEGQPFSSEADGGVPSPLTEVDPLVAEIQCRLRPFERPDCDREIVVEDTGIAALPLRDGQRERTLHVLPAVAGS